MFVVDFFKNSFFPKHLRCTLNRKVANGISADCSNLTLSDGDRVESHVVFLPLLFVES
jgi:hypothetical protein